MFKLFRPLFCLLFIVYCLFASAQRSSAVQEFTTDYHSTYRIGVDGVSSVDHEIHITNNLATIYPKIYTLSVGSTTLQDVQATDGDNHTLTVGQEQSGNSNNIKVTLAISKIGLGQTTTLHISYTTPDIIAHTGSVWEINLPRLKQGGEMNSVTRTVIFPRVLGTPTSSVPTPDEISTTSDATTVVYRGNKNSSISLLFGDSQWYQLDLDYYLERPLSSGAYTEIALPPDTGYQHVILNSLTPKPETITVDQDGNWLARYPYSTDFDSHIHAELYVEISPLPSYFDPSTKSTKPYLTGSKYWPLDSPIVKETGSRLKTSKNIYDYLLTSFSYNYSRVLPGADRLGATRALESPSMAICTEFTDTFISLTRSQGIASREINGYAVTTNTKLRPLSLATDVLHAWPEYYDVDQNKWISTDPTWGNTTGGLDYYSKLDFNHITFVRHGLEPTYPYPAGVYKKNVEDKTITLKLIDPPPDSPPDYSVVKLDNQEYQIKNIGRVALIDQDIRLGGKELYHIDYLPPFGEVTTTTATPRPPSLPLFTIITVSLITLVAIVYLTMRYRSR